MNRTFALLVLPIVTFLSGCTTLMAGEATGPGAILLTVGEYPDFVTAKGHSVTTIKDGDDVWAYVRFDEPLSAWANVSEFTDSTGKPVVNRSFNLLVLAEGLKSSDWKQADQTLFIHGGEKSSDGRVYNSDTTTRLQGISPEAKEFKVRLARYVRGQSASPLLATLGQGKAIDSAVTFRLEGRSHSVNGSRTNDVAETKVTFLGASGIAQYRQAWLAYEQVLQKGDVLDNTLPPVGRFNDPLIKDEVVRTAKTSGLQPEKVFFSSDEWTSYWTNEVLGLKERRVYGFILYKKGAGWAYGMAEILQKSNSAGVWGPFQVSLYQLDSPIDAKKVPQ